MTEDKADIANQLRAQIVQSDRKLSEKMSILKYFMERKNFNFFGKRQQLLELTLFLGPRVAKTGTDQDKDLYLDLFFLLLWKFELEFVRNEPTRMSLFKSLRGLMRYEILRFTDQDNVNVFQRFLSSLEVHLKNEELGAFCYDLLNQVILHSSCTDFSEKTLEWVFDKLVSCAGENGDQSWRDDLKMSPLASKLLAWGKDLTITDLNLLNESVKGEELKQAWRRNLSSLLQEIFFGKVLRSGQLTNTARERSSVEEDTLRNDVVDEEASENAGSKNTAPDKNAGSKEGEVEGIVDLDGGPEMHEDVGLDKLIVSCLTDFASGEQNFMQYYGVWLHELGVLSAGKVDPCGVVETMVESVVSSEISDLDKLNVLLKICLALRETYDLSLWVTTFDPPRSLRRTFKMIVGQMAALFESTDNENKNCADVQLNLMTVMLALDGVSVSKLMFPAMTLAISNNYSLFIVASLKHYVETNQLVKYFRSYILPALQKAHFTINEETFFQIFSAYFSAGNVIDLDSALDLTKLLMEMYLSVGEDQKLPAQNILMRFANIFLGLVWSSTLACADSIRAIIEFLVQSLQKLIIDESQCTLLVQFCILLKTICSTFAETRILLTEVESFVSKVAKVSNRGEIEVMKHSNWFVTFFHARESDEIESGYSKLSKQLLISALSTEVEVFLRHPLVFADMKFQKILYSEIKERRKLPTENNLGGFEALLNSSVVTSELGLKQLPETSCLTLTMISAVTSKATSEVSLNIVIDAYLNGANGIHNYEALDKILSWAFKKSSDVLSSELFETLKILIKGIKNGEKASDGYEIQKVQFLENVISLILVRMKFSKHQFDMTALIPKKLAKYLSTKFSRCDAFTPSSGDESFLETAYHLFCCESLDRHIEENFSQICSSIVSKRCSENHGLVCHLLVVLFRIKFANDSEIDSGKVGMDSVKDALLIFTLKEEKSRQFINSLLACFPKLYLEELATFLLQYLAAVNAMKPENARLKTAGKREDGVENKLVFVLELLISKYGKDQLKLFYSQVVSQFFLLQSNMGNSEKLMWIRLVHAGARHGNFLIDYEQTAVVLNCLKVESHQDHESTCKLLEVELMLLLGVLSERPKYLQTYVFVLILCQLFELLLHLCSSKKLKVKPNSSGDVGQPGMKRKHPETNEYSSSISSEVVESAEQKENSTRILGKNVDIFRSIVVGCKALAEKGKPIVAQVLATYLVTCRNRIVKAQFQAQFRALIQHLVDSIKKTHHLNFVMSHCNKADKFVVLQFQKDEV